MSKCATVSHHQYQVAFISRYNASAEDVHMMVLLDVPKVSSLAEKKLQNYLIHQIVSPEKEKLGIKQVGYF